MATILIIDDHPTNREVLVTLLGYQGHRLLEAGDGVEALEQSRAEQPDLVISDILMPTMDGYEFVRRLRAEPALAQTPIIFYTAHYHEQEARALAQACGVNHILTKPSKPRVILQSVEAALGCTSPPAPPPAEAFDREHLRLLTDKLSGKNEELRLANSRLSTLVDIHLQLASERDPQRLLQTFCHAARELMGAKYATVRIFPKDEPGQRHFFTSGLSAEVAAGLEAVSSQMDTPAPLLSQRRPFHLRNYSGDPEMVGFPPAYPPFEALLVAPIVSPDQVYGWFCMFDKVGAEEFNAADEQLATLLAAMVGRVYENRQLYAEVRRRSEELEHEVVERQQTGEALRQSEERFAKAFRASPDVLFITRQADGKILEVNDSWETLTEYSRDESLGRTTVELKLIDAATRQQGLAMLRERPGSMREAELKLRRKSGEVRQISTSVEAMVIGEEACFLTIIRDITERKRAEEELRQTAAELTRSNLDLEQFAYVASHDLQEPLRAVAGTVQLLQQRYAGQLDARADELIRHAVEGATRMQTLINDLLIFSRIATRGQPFKPTDCAAPLSNALANLAVAIKESGAVITHDPLPTVLADPTQLGQLFQNLIGNAIKFRGEAAPAIHIEVTQKDGECLFAVRDNGIGMEVQYFERIFAVFQRLHTRREYAGTGIGLAICKKIVERHGGRIWVESQPGQGSTFYFTLPHTGFEPVPEKRPGGAGRTESRT